MEVSDEKSKGLSDAEAAKKLEQFGPNQLVRASRISFLGIAKEEVVEPLILLLLVVGVIYTVFGGWQDALTIFSIIFVLVFVEIWNEYRAKKAISALSELASPKTKVLRNSILVEVETRARSG
jgi:Ca2+-transporting ATPase